MKFRSRLYQTSNLKGTPSSESALDMVEQTTLNYPQPNSLLGLSRPLFTLAIFVLGLSLMNCSQRNSNSIASSPQTNQPGIIGGPNTGSNTGGNAGGGSQINQPIFQAGFGETVRFEPDSLQMFSNYVFSRPLNNPSNFQLNVNLVRGSSGAYGGQVRIGYYDNNQVFIGTFGTQNPTGQTTNLVSFRDYYKGLTNEVFNVWFNHGGKVVYHGFFQDAYGAIVLVIDGAVDNGDGGRPSIASGSVYFKNFRLAPAPQYMGGAGEMCWFLLPPSPYECGTFKVGDQVRTDSALYPSANDGYRRLGTFSGLRIGVAFRD